MQLPSLKAADKSKDIILMCEVHEEATYVRHHKKKIAFIFSAMRHHAKTMEKAGWQVDYVSYDAPRNKGSFFFEVQQAIVRHNIQHVHVTKGSEVRVVTDQEGWEGRLGTPVTLYDDDRFICTRDEFAQWAKGRKTLRMEYFYREMRRKTGLLMDGDEPEAGNWNFDSENRKPASVDLFMPAPYHVRPDQITQDVLHLIAEHFNDHPGTLLPFRLGVTQQHANNALDHFIKEALPHFGDYQDAMLTGEKFLYHSVLSHYINIGLLNPLHVCKRVENAYYDGHAPINAVEGFIRQIIGWREYVNGIYWYYHDNQPDKLYTDQNFFNADRPLPDYYWTGDTRMSCMKAAISQTLEDAYAHHIQRLMVTGLFAMLIGVDPKEVHEWYLAVYADAYEWVEAPNTIGMSQYADGGQLGSKPYAASGAYINRMSDYCKNCHYDVKKKTEDEACPFNALYWDFLMRHESKLKANPRMAQMYRTWARMKPDTQKAYLKKAKTVLDNVNSL